jgi:hypothetical protein
MYLINSLKLINKNKGGKNKQNVVTIGDALLLINKVLNQWLISAASQVFVKAKWALKNMVLITIAWFITLIFIGTIVCV